MNNKNEIIKENNEQLSDYVKDLLKPENIVGEFSFTQEMIDSLLKD